MAVVIITIMLVAIESIATHIKSKYVMHCFVSKGKVIYEIDMFCIVIGYITYCNIAINMKTMCEENIQIVCCIEIDIIMVFEF